jgi:single-strand DNA-binding protein
VAVNKRKTQNNQDPGADFFRVSAWRELGENCAKWLIKGKKVCVVGPVSVSVYTGNDGKSYANLEVQANEVEFLSPAGQTEAQPAQEPPKIDEQSGMQQVEMDELPF